MSSQQTRIVELADGTVIRDVTRTAMGSDGLLNVHTPGKGHRVVDPDDVVRDETVAVGEVPA